MTLTNSFGQPVGEPLPDGWTPPAPPVATTLAGDWCTLEPLMDVDHDALWREFAAADDSLWTYMTFGPMPSAEAWRAEAERLASTSDAVAFAVCVDDRPVGTASIMRIGAGPGTAEIGCVVFAPALQRTTAATEAIYLLCRYVLRDNGFRRLEWKCDTLNAPSRRSAVRFGFRPEGVWRKATAYKGRTRDTAWYAMTDDDFAALAPAYAEWFAAARAVEGTATPPPPLGDFTARALQEVDALAGADAGDTAG